MVILSSRQDNGVVDLHHIKFKFPLTLSLFQAYLRMAINSHLTSTALIQGWTVQLRNQERSILNPSLIALSW